MLILDVHVLDERTGPPWRGRSMPPSRSISRPASGRSPRTWEVGDLLYTPTDATVTQLRASLQPALDEFCQLYRGSRPAPPPAAPEACSDGTAL